MRIYGIPVSHSAMPLSVVPDQAEWQRSGPDRRQSLTNYSASCEEPSAVLIEYCAPCRTGSAD
jgi:hypothetical protein